MNLRDRMLLIVVVTTVVVTSVLYGSIWVTIRARFSELEGNEMRRNVARAVSILEMDSAALHSYNNDWSSWDDTYEFAQDRNSAYIEANLVDDTFGVGKINFLVVVGASGRILFSKGYDWLAKKPLPVPASLEKQISGTAPVFERVMREEPAQGLLMLPGTPLLISAHPILTSKNQGPPRGVLMMGRFLDLAAVGRLAQTARLSLEVFRVGDEAAPADVGEAGQVLQAGQSAFVRPLDEYRVAGYALLRDIGGKPALILRADAARDIFARGLDTAYQSLLLVLLACLVFAFLIIHLLRRLVLEPVARIESWVQSIRTFPGGPSGALLGGKDEVARLAVAISDMLEALGRSKDALSESEKKYRTLTEELERRVALRTTELEAANKELETFSYSVSHDLRAPLRSIDGYTQMVLKDCGDRLDEDGQANLRRVRAAAENLGQLIDDLLALSRVARRELRRERVDISALARDITGQLQRGDPARHVAVVVADGAEAEGDAQLLRVVLQNLLENAWKFTSKQEEAEIEFGIADPSILPIPHSPLGMRVFFVRDNGAGFDMAYAGKLFQPFERLHSRTEFDGTGIGLATVQRILRRHGGLVWAEGEVGKGATFYFMI